MSDHKGLDDKEAEKLMMPQKQPKVLLKPLFLEDNIPGKDCKWHNFKFQVLLFNSDSKIIYREISGKPTHSGTSN